MSIDPSDNQSDCDWSCSGWRTTIFVLPNTAPILLLSFCSRISKTIRSREWPLDG